MAIGDPTPTKVRAAPTTVSNVHEGVNAVSFHVSRVGTPVLVKVSYFPNWQVAGATGPYRVTPNLMVVVPTAHNVVLRYGASRADHIGEALSGLGLIALVSVVVVAWVRNRWGQHRKSRRSSAPKVVA